MGNNFRSELIQRYWKYQQKQFPDVQKLFELPQGLYGRPPVFLREQSWKNIIINPEADQEQIYDLLNLVPKGEQHKWYRSMNSSQALAQSVLGNLKIYNLIEILSDLQDDDGNDIFGKSVLNSDSFELEYKVNYLGEPRSTSLDGYVAGKYRIAIECKFTEVEIGTCSRPRMRPLDGNYESQYCDSTYSHQRGRNYRCSLSEIGVKYWEYIPFFFKWNNDIDHNPCPLNSTYQLVRNVLSVGVNTDGTVSSNNGYVVLIYDERNPAFNKDGKAIKAYNNTVASLHYPKMLRKCSWQRIIKHMREEGVLPWLIDELNKKYGL